MRLTAAITKEDEWYVARCLEINVASQGHTIDEAITNLKEAIELYLEDEEQPIETNAPIIAPIEV